MRETKSPVAYRPSCFALKTSRTIREHRKAHILAPKNEALEGVRGRSRDQRNRASALATMGLAKEHSTDAAQLTRILAQVSEFQIT